jgi:hypothetical protein
MKVCAPTGRKHSTALKSAQALERLEGAQIVLLDNGKWNGGKLLRHLGEMLKAREATVRLRFERKPFFSRVADADLIERLASGASAVVTAIGD